MNSDSKSSKPKGPKAFDIFQPNRRRTSPTSRPIIVSNKPEQDDPMVLKHRVSEANKPEKTNVPTPEVAASDVADQAPVTEQTVSTPEVPEAVIAAASETDDDIPEMGSSIQPEEAPVEAVSVETNKADEATPAPQVVENTELQPSGAVPSEEPSDEDLAWTSATVKSAATQEPIISIHHTGRSRRVLTMIVWVVVVLVVLAAAADVVLDAGWWTPSFSVPHTHFIKHD